LPGKDYSKDINLYQDHSRKNRILSSGQLNLISSLTGIKLSLKINNRKGQTKMPIYLDIHQHVEGLTKDAVEGAHARDLEVQGKHGVKYLKYWFNEETGKVFCLVEAPSKEAANAVHREAHGLVADELIEVKEGK
jgi:uncharacterized protein DUF4242